MMGPSRPHGSARLAGRGMKARNRLQFPNLASAGIIQDLEACSSPLSVCCHISVTPQLTEEDSVVSGAAAPALGLSQLHPKALGSARCSPELLLPPLPQFNPSLTGNTQQCACYGRNILVGLLPPVLAQVDFHLEVHTTASTCWITKVNSSPSKVKAIPEPRLQSIRKPHRGVSMPNAQSAGGAQGPLAS